MSKSSGVKTFRLKEKQSAAHSCLHRTTRATASLQSDPGSRFTVMSNTATQALQLSGWSVHAAHRTSELLAQCTQPGGASALWAVVRGANLAPPVEELRRSQTAVISVPGNNSPELAIAYAHCVAASLCAASGVAAVSVRSSEQLRRDAASPLALAQDASVSSLLVSEVPHEPAHVRIACGSADVVAPVDELTPRESLSSSGSWIDAVSPIVSAIAGPCAGALVESLFECGCHSVVFATSTRNCLNTDSLLTHVHDGQVVCKGASLAASETHDSAELLDRLEAIVSEQQSHAAATPLGSEGGGTVARNEHIGSGSVALSKRSPKRRESMLLHPSGDAWTEDQFRASGPPLYQTATFAQPAATEMGPYDYTRSGNPTRDMLEQHMAELEGAVGSVAYATGMLAISSATRLIPAGGRIVAPDDLYGGTSRLLENVVPNQGVEVVYAQPRNLADWKEKINGGPTGLVIIESPTNPRMQIADISAICSLAREADALSLVDNSVMAPLLQSPLALGADISMTSATKFLSGHADLSGGFLASKDDHIMSQLWFRQNAEGTMLPPFDCWLTIRGLKTMSVRMEKQQDNAQKIAHFLYGHPLVKRVNYPGLKNHEGFETHMKQAKGPGSILSFETGNTAISQLITEETALFKITVSFGSTHSLISMPCYMSHASIPESVREERGLPNNLVRISAGVEDAADLLADLDQAMRKASKAME